MGDKWVWQKGLLWQGSALLAVVVLGAFTRVNLAAAWSDPPPSSPGTSFNQRDAVAPGGPSTPAILSSAPSSLAQAPAEAPNTLPLYEETQPDPEALPGEEARPDPRPVPQPDPSIPPAAIEPTPTTADSVDALDDLLEGVDPGANAAARTVNLTLPDLLNLTLQGNRDLRNSALGRIVQRQQLNAAEQAFNPRFIPTLSVDATRRLSAGGNSASANADQGLQLFGDFADTEAQALLTTTLTTRQGTDISVEVDPLRETQPVTVNVTQPLMRGAGRAVNEAPVEQARLSETQNQLALRIATTETITTAITRYTTLIQQQRNVAIQEQALERRQQDLTVQTALFEAGRRARVELFELERSVADAQRDLANAQNQLLQANNGILNLIGTDQNLVFVASEETVTQLFTAAVARSDTFNQEDLIALALQQRPDYRQAQLERQQIELDQLVARDNLRWQLDARGRGNLGNFSAATVGLVATRTFDDPQLETNRVSSDVALEQQDNTLAKLQEEIRNNVIADLESVRANLRAVEAAFRATENAQLQLEAARTQFRLGRGNITQFQLLEQEDRLVVAQSAELSAEIAFLNAIARLDQTVGITLESWAGQVTLPPALREIEETVTP